jgi:hypothetical protein
MKLKNGFDKFLGFYLFLVVFVVLGFLSLKAPGALTLLNAKKTIAAGAFPTETGMIKTNKIQCEIKYCSGVPCGCKAESDNPLSKLCAQLDPGQCSMNEEIYGTSVGGTNTKDALIISLVAASMAGYKAGDSIIAGGTGELITTVFATPGGCYGCGS